MPVADSASIRRTRSSGRQRPLGLQSVAGADLADRDATGKRRPGQRPVHRGSRFSLNAAMPSARSSEATAARHAPSSSSRPSASGTPEAAVDGPLWPRERPRGRRADLGGQVRRRVRERPAEPIRLTIPQACASSTASRRPVKIELLRPRHAAPACQQLRPPAAGDDPHGRLGQPEHRVVGRHDQVAGQRQLEPAAQCEPEHRGDRRHGHRRGRRRTSPAIRSRFWSQPASIQCVSFLEVGADAERPVARRGEHHDARVSAGDGAGTRPATSIGHLAARSRSAPRAATA